MPPPALDQTPCGRSAAAVRGAPDVAACSPDLVLIDAALAQVSRAQSCLEDDCGELAGTLLSNAIGKVCEFRRGLHCADPLAANLDDLCDYMSRRLLAASRHNEVAPVAEVSHLLHEVRSAWVTLTYV